MHTATIMLMMTTVGTVIPTISAEKPTLTNIYSDSTVRKQAFNSNKTIENVTVGLHCNLKSTRRGPIILSFDYDLICYSRQCANCGGSSGLTIASLSVELPSKT